MTMSIAVEPTGRLVETPVDEWRRGWRLLMMAFLCYGVSVVYAFGFGFYIAPIQREMGWGRAQISAGLLAASLIGVVASPFVGRLIDHYGARRVAMPGMALYCVGLVLVGHSGHSIWQWWALWVILAIGQVPVNATTWVAVVSKAFDKQRGLALSLMVCGSGVTVMILPGILTPLIASHGWRTTYTIVGGGCAILALPLMFFFLHDSGTLRTVSAGGFGVAGIPYRRAITSSRFFRLAIVSFGMTTALVGLNVHLIPLLDGMGVSKISIARSVALVGAGSIVGRLVVGFLLDRRFGPPVAAIAFLVPAVATASLILGVDRTPLLYVVTFAVGFSLGSEIQLISYLTPRYFGMRECGTIFGSIVALWSLASGVGPTLAGAAFDHFGTYQPYLIGCLVVFLLCSVTVATLGAYPNFESDITERFPS